MALCQMPIYQKQGVKKEGKKKGKEKDCCSLINYMKSVAKYYPPFIALKQTFKQHLMKLNFPQLGFISSHIWLAGQQDMQTPNLQTLVKSSSPKSLFHQFMVSQKVLLQNTNSNLVKIINLLIASQKVSKIELIISGIIMIKHLTTLTET